MPVIHRLQNAMLEEKSSLSSDDGSQSADTDGMRTGSIGTIPLKGKSRSWLSASRLQENLKKAVNTPFARSKSMTNQLVKPDPPQSETFRDATGHKDSASLSFTAITESLSASSEDISEALGRKFEQLLHSALSSSEDSSSLQPSSNETSQSAPSDDGTNGSRLWSTIFHQTASRSQSKDEDDTHTTDRSSTRSQGTAELIGQFLASVSSTSSSKPVASSDSQHGGGMLSLIDGSGSDDEDIDEGADLALFDEESSSSSCSDMYSSDDGDSMAQDDDLLVAAISTVLAKMDGQCGAFLGRNSDGDVDSIASDPPGFVSNSAHQQRGRSRSPRPYTPFGLEMEPSEEDGTGFESQNPLEATPKRNKEGVDRPALDVFRSMFSCFSPPNGTFPQNL